MNFSSAKAKNHPAEFESYYTKVRKHEGRIYTDSEVQHLPYLDKGSRHSEEWKLRAKSLKRFQNYLSKNKFNCLLEIGCGNGWFTNYCADYVDTAIGIDVNQLELDQAVRVFGNQQLKFYYWDVFTQPPFDEKPDCIVLNAVVQYFKDFDLLISRLKELISDGGEIHIIDSPFYSARQVKKAAQRSKEYYSKMNVPEMAEHYFHHNKEKIRSFDVLYQARFNPFAKLFKPKDSPFPWIRLKVSH